MFYYGINCVKENQNKKQVLATHLPKKEFTFKKIKNKKNVNRPKLKHTTNIINMFKNVMDKKS